MGGREPKSVTVLFFFFCTGYSVQFAAMWDDFAAFLFVELDVFCFYALMARVLRFLLVSVFAFVFFVGVVWF